MVRLIPDSEPAPTISANTESRDRWVYRNGNQDNAAERALTEPAPTVHFGHALNSVKWTKERPEPTVVTTRRSKDGLLVGRQMAEGEGENVGGWGYERPSTTVAGDQRIFQPGGHHEPGQQSQNAVRVTIVEAAVLQSFRPDYPWGGSRTKQFEQVGNAVPPVLAHAVIAALLNPPTTGPRPQAGATETDAPRAPSRGTK